MMLICGVLASCSSEDESTAPLPDGKYPLQLTAEVAQCIWDHLQPHGVAVVVEDAWGEAVDPQKLEDALKAHPDAKVVAGYAVGTMPSYATMLTDDQVKAIVAYIRSLPGDGQ